MKTWFRDPENAQSASELAIFGSVLIFVIGMILRTGISASQSSNYQLRAFRMAMTESFKTSQGFYRGGGPSNGRTNASVFIIEDRLSVDGSDPRGTRDRIPFYAQGSATFSSHLFLTTDLWEYFNIPTADVIINGQRFPLMTADFKVYRTHDPDTNELLYPVCPAPLSTPPPKPVCNDSEQFPFCSEFPPIGACWDPQCMVVLLPDPARCDPDSRVACTFLLPIDVGCLRVHTKIPNFSDSTDWCGKRDAGACDANLPPRERFDLNLNKVYGEVDLGDPADSDDDRFIDVPDFLDDRMNFGWQWLLLAGVKKDSVKNIAMRDMEGNVMTGIEVPRARDGQNVLFDIDGDFKEEYLVHTATGQYGVITEFYVVDSQEGDTDPTIDDSDLGYWQRAEADPGACRARAPRGPCKIGDTRTGPNLNNQCVVYRCVEEENGLRDDFRMYSFTRAGTYLRVEEGQLFDALSGHFIRNTTRQDHVDIVERVFKLSNNTQRFCIKGTPPVRRDWAGDVNWAKAYGVVGMTNPVEACGQCFAPGNIEKTCMETFRDPLTRHEDHIIFIRSRIKDMRGHRWLSRTDL